MKKLITGFFSFFFLVFFFNNCAPVNSPSLLSNHAGQGAINSLTCRDFANTSGVTVQNDEACDSSSHSCCNLQTEEWSTQQQGWCGVGQEQPGVSTWDVK